MSEEPVKKEQKMNIIGKLSIVATLAIMVWSKFTHTEGTVLSRLFNGVLLYGFCIIGGIAATIFFRLGIYLATLFTNTIYDEDEDGLTWNGAEQELVLFSAIIYISILAGWINI